MSRRSLFGGYSSHQQPNISKYSYPSDVSLSSHYGYTSWGLWRGDTGNLSPSIYSKKRINIRSFSILIMSAAFIVLLAVLSVAGLAFYFSTFKSDPAESTLVFDCAFRVAKGDVFTSGLKYNHTAIYRQRAAFYSKFIETSLEHGNFNVARTEINGFGSGPDIQLSFRIYLDMRKIQMTITNVEEHIKNAFISETAVSESTFRNLKIDDDSIEIKRQLDPEILRQASYFREQTQEPPNTTLLTMPTTVIPLDELPPSSKKLITSTPASATERGKSKLSTIAASKIKKQPKPIQESDIDMENLPVIQGSFEITKTDADIAQKRSDANQPQRPSSTASLTPNTLKPFFISPASSMNVKAKPSVTHSKGTSTITASTSTTTQRMDTTHENIVELFLQHQKQQQQQQKLEHPVTAKIEKTNKNGESTRSGQQQQQTSTTSPHDASADFADSQINKDLPKLDVSLFTSAPVLDNEPWRPINPSTSQLQPNNPQQQQPLTTSLPSTLAESTEASSPVYRSPFENGNGGAPLMYRNKFVDPETIHPASPAALPQLNETGSDDSVFYQSFYNPDFSGAGDLLVEKLGIADVRPYPLPVNKLEIAPAFKPLDDGTATMEVEPNYDEDKFEHLGGGVIAKINPPQSAVPANVNDTRIHGDEGDDNDMETKNNDDNNSNEDDKDDEDDKHNATATVERLGDIFQELLNLDQGNDVQSLNGTTNNEELESRILPEDDDGDDISDDSTEQVPSTASTERLNFMNMKNFIVQMQKHNKSEDDDEDEQDDSSSSDELSASFEMISSTAAAAASATTRTTEKPTTTFVEIETLKYTPTAVTTTTASQSTVTGPQLFPAISKWEFVNGTRSNGTLEAASVTRKVFNETLQAVIVENSQTTPSHGVGAGSRFDDLMRNANNRTEVDKTNLQQLSSIFDTLAAKLGIKPDVVSKTPPFSNKLNRTRTASTSPTTKRANVNVKLAGTTSKRPAAKLTTKKVVTTTTRKPTTTAARVTTPSERITFETSSMEASLMMGQAEVEAVDPTKYDEILSLVSSSPVTRITSTTPSLVTLLPVKSNSGIRNFNPRLKLAAGRPQALPSESGETVVKASMSFDA